MSTSILTPARAAYYDRNAATAVQGVDTGNAAPHADTQRTLITCASGKKAFLELVSVALYRSAAAATVGFWGTYHRITSGATNFQLMEYQSVSNTVGYTYAHTLGLQTTIYAGETFAGYTYDGSTDGTCRFILGLKGTTFDA